MQSLCPDSQSATPLAVKLRRPAAEVFACRLSSRLSCGEWRPRKGKVSPAPWLAADPTRLFRRLFSLFFLAFRRRRTRRIRHKRVRLRRASRSSSERNRIFRLYHFDGLFSCKRKTKLWTLGWTRPSSRTDAGTVHTAQWPEGTRPNF